MRFFKNFMDWIKTAKVSVWRTNDKELTDATKPPGGGRVGSYEGHHQDGDTYEGIKISIPLPEEKK